MEIIRNIGQQPTVKKQSSPADLIAVLRSDPEAMAGFMIANNPGIVNATLRQMGYDKLAFAPDNDVLAHQLQTFINTGNWGDFNTVIDKFKLKTYGQHPDFIKLFNQTFNK